jgi:uncharacterized SAM-binding protein YcdF (DUF218 family)
MSSKPDLGAKGAAWWNAAPAGIALFLGGFSLLNLIGELRWHGFDASLWWVDMGALPPFLARVVLLICGLALLAFGLHSPRSVWRRSFTVACGGFLGAVSLMNSIHFYVLIARGKIQAGIPVPLSLAITLGLVAVVVQAWQPRSALPPRTRLFSACAVALLCALLFPLGQMFLLGKTDYRRPAEVAVVLGARAYADGRPSVALADRVRTACELYHDGLVKKLLFSGGPGDGPVHETESMTRMAIGLGVRPEDILVDTHGLNTRATTRNTLQLLDELKASRVLVVSHFYHLPRVKLSYQRQLREVCTVPARESYLLGQIPFNMAREIVALWVYYLRP